MCKTKRNLYGRDHHRNRQRSRASSSWKMDLAQQQDKTSPVLATKIVEEKNIDKNSNLVYLKKKSD
ncbi:hypothetical protein BpHYR1_004158 [Brachionus plicatilis]|uniref:Uncharacterized protein n=1 Tax=Brachionus plicatilis TaxID=10195 RepID=A0A3M7PFZ3_BRAPC|nr:hypothetical protein BpHYR1_004158 [Brachionus plicatilis]